jgi:hypothetical protein
MENRQHCSKIPASKVQEPEANRKVDEPLNNNKHSLQTHTQRPTNKYHNFLITKRKERKDKQI